jgi:copper chaperone
MTEQLLVQVEGMSCGGCEQRISTALARLEGIRHSTADHSSGQVRVAYDPEHVSAGTVRGRLEEMGYAVVSETGAD